MSKTIFINHKSSSPFFNLAAEEYLLHERDEDVVFLYTNSNAVVIGKHQNAFDECNQDYCSKNNIITARRLSGGGTVFHSEGNLNFCFIQNGSDSDKLIDFKKHLEPINAFLHSIGIPSEYSGRNDLLVQGYKVSGNAEHIYSKKKRIIHHGTLLFSADLSSLKAAIQPKTSIEFSSHAVKSVRSQVANLEDFLPNPMTFDEFEEQLANFLIRHFSAETHVFGQKEIDVINELVDRKYSTWDWNYGYSPTFSARLLLDQNKRIEVNVKKGVITEASMVTETNRAPLHNLIGKNYRLEELNKLGIGDFKPYF